MKNKKFSAFSFVELSIVILIIGILIAGVVSASRLVGEYRLTTARNTSSSSAVASISGVVLWLDATASGKVESASGVEAVDATAVSTWIDSNPQTTNLFSFTASAGGPSYKRDGINNLPTLSFDGNATGAVGSLGCLTTAYSGVLNPAKFTTFIVARPIVEVTSNSGALYYSMVTTAGSGAGYSMTKTNGKLTTTSVSAATPALVQTEGAATISSNVVFVSKRTATQMVSYLNGATLEAETAAFLPNTTAASFIGCNSTAATYFNGYISEVIMYERDLKDEERKAVEGYLGKKYGIKIS